MQWKLQKKPPLLNKSNHETKDCFIRLSTYKDYKNLFNLYFDSQVNAYVFGGKITPERTRELNTLKNRIGFFLMVTNWFPSLLGHRFIIEKKDSHEFIGTLGITSCKKEFYDFPDMHIKKKYLNIGRAFKKEYQNKGYGTQVLNQLDKLINKKLQAEVFCLTTNNENESAKKSAEKAGFTLYGKKEFKNGVFIPSIGQINNNPTTMCIYTRNVKKK